MNKQNSTQTFDVVIVGAGSAGIATASSLLKRQADLSIVLIDPSQDHYYQPGWTMVGGGIFQASDTHRKTADLIPSGASWVSQSVTEFNPQENTVVLDDGQSIVYQQLIVASGLTLDWAGIDGLEDALGKNGVTSNYRYDLAPYTWELVQNLKQGNAVFTQSPMPIKCAGAPQKALYLSADHWFKQNRINDVNVSFYNAAPVLFGVADYVPALMEYMEKYRAELNFTHNLISVDGAAKTATFKAGEETIVKDFDFLHVCPPQRAPDFIRDSSLSDDAGWLSVNPATLQHTEHANIWGVGDVMNTMNAKTMAAARKQAPVVAQNVVNQLAGSSSRVEYNGYGSCPLTVEKGKIVLAEFAYGGKLVPTFPTWMNEGTQPSRFAWHLKANVLPSVYWNAMLKGREWLASPD